MSKKIGFGRISLILAILSIGSPIVGKMAYGGMNVPPGPPVSGFHPYWPFQVAAILGLIAGPIGLIAFIKKSQRLSGSFGVLISFFWIIILFGLQKMLSQT